METLKSKNPLSRRQFIQMASSGASVLLAQTQALAAARQNSVRVGVIADLHHGLAPSALGRLEDFMHAVEVQKPDCLLQLGDFNYGKPDSKECLDLWRQFRGPRYHVLGNHDMDFNTKETMTDLWRMPARHYSFDLAGFHFVVLDRNNLKTPDGYVPYSKANFYVNARMRGFADPEQLEWLKADLLAAQLPVVVWVHQGLGMREDYTEGDPRQEIEVLLESVNREKSRGRVIACFCGHEHLDRHRLKNGIHYQWINSASYYWVGPDFGRMAFYRDALYTFITFDTKGLIEIEGRKSDWEKPTPAQRGFPRASELTPHISSRRLRFEV